MSKRMSNSEYDKLIINSSLIRIGDYINTNHSIAHLCKICNSKFNIIPKSVLNGSKCKCQSKKVYKNRLSNDEYNFKLLKTNYKSLSVYQVANIPILHICKQCNTTKLIKPSKALKNIGCNECNRLLYKSKYLSILNDTTLQLVSEYINSKTKVEHFCNECDSITYIRPNDVSYGVGCSVCNVSKGEYSIMKYLKLNNIQYIKEKVFDDSKFRFDFYLPKYNIFIEYDGIQHYKPVEFFGGDEYFNSVIENDSYKNEYCIANNIKLIRIPYYDFDNINDILSKQISHLII